MKVVLIGCGLIARSHAQVLCEIDGAELAGVCDQRAEAAQSISDEYNCKAYTDAAEMLADIKPDAAVICVPTYFHKDYVMLCAKYGVNVLCEKPLEKTVEASIELVNTVKNSNIVFMTAQVVRFWPGYVEIKEMFDNDEIGDVYMMHLRRVSSKTGQYGQWLFKPELGGGAMYDMLVHDVDFLRYIAGPFKQCYANASKDETGCYNNVMANIIHKNGIQALAEVSFTMQTGYPFSFSVSIVGTKATVEYSYSAGATIADRKNSKSEMKIWRKNVGLEVKNIELYDAYKRQMEYFLNCVKENKQPEIITPEQSLEVITMIKALHRSADTGKIVEIE